MQGPASPLVDKYATLRLGQYLINPTEVCVSTTSELESWEVIEKKLASIYAAQEPKHWGAVMPSGPLHGLSAYWAENPTHWHFVTYGFSETHEKTSSDQEVSGWGFELCLRIKPHADDQGEPPLWPWAMLQQLARYVCNNSMPFDHEHYIRWGGPITSDDDTELEALIFTEDRQLGTIVTPNGRLKFLTAIGITADEHQFAADQGPEKLLARLLPQNPLGVSDLQRHSVFS